MTAAPQGPPARSAINSWLEQVGGEGRVLLADYEAAHQVGARPRPAPS